MDLGAGAVPGMSLVTHFGTASAETLAGLVERHPDYRVLRRLQPMSRYGGSERRLAIGVSGCALTVETTGPDYRHDEVIELALQRFRADEAGRIVDVGPMFRWVEGGSVAVPCAKRVFPERVDRPIAEQRIVDAEAVGMILDADFVVAHGAAVDRPFVERRFPSAAGQRWVCSVRDIDWRAAGFEGQSLSYLLLQMGWFCESNRTTRDLSALLHVLDHSPDRDVGRTMLARAIATASKPTWRIEAVNAPFEARDRLEFRGYRLDAPRRLWWIEVTAEALDEEIEWFATSLCNGESRPAFRQINWTQRYAVE